MKQFFLKLWQDEAGAETAEWLVIVALIVVVAVAVYNTTLSQMLSDLITSIRQLLANVPAPTT